MKLLSFAFLALSGLFQQPGALADRAEEAFRSGDLDTAQSLARQVLAKEPNSVQAHMILGVVAAQQQKWEAANLHFGAVVRLAPSAPHGYFYLGQANLYQHNWAKAADYFTQALQRNYPDRERLVVELAYAENEAGRPKQALATLQKIQPPTEGPHAAQFQAVTAFVREKLNQLPPAVEAIRRAIEIDDSNPQYWEFLVSSLISSDQVNTAVAEAIRGQRDFRIIPGFIFFSAWRATT